MQALFETAIFGHFKLDWRRRLLSANGRPVELDDKTLDLLAYLIENRASAVSHDDTLAAVWPDRIVSENNLSVQLSKLRKALVKADCSETLILTLPGRRYQFVGDVRIDEKPPMRAPEAAEAADSATTSLEQAAPQPSPTSPLDRPAPAPPALRGHTWPLFAGISAACGVAALAIAWFAWPAHPEPPRLSTVVLPFRNASADRSADYLADAVTDDLTADLSHLPASTVIARESAQAVQHETPQQIGRDLGVRYIVTGSVAPEEGHFHILASLIDTATGRQLWTTQFDPARDQISQVRPTIVRRIALPLGVEFNQLESARSLRDRPDDPDALGLFFRARSLLDTSETRADFAQAHELLQRAIAKQPDFVDAKAELGWALLREVTTVTDPDEIADREEARRAIHEALAASPQNTTAIAARALDLYVMDDCNAAEQAASDALVLDPSSVNARSVLAGCAQSKMQFDRAVTDYDFILQLNPASAHTRVIHLIIGTLDLMRDKVGDAVRELGLAQHPDAPSTGDMEPAEQAQLLLVAALELSGDHARAHADFADYERRYPGRSVWRVSGYFDAGWRQTSGLQRALHALADAGLPAFSDEAEPGLGDALTCTQGAFAATPSAAPVGSTLVTTARFAAALAMSPPPVVIDLGRGVAAEQSWHVLDPLVRDETGLAFARRIADEQAGADKSAVLIVLGDGVRGCDAFDAVGALVAAGYRHVQWYRGGEEAWARTRRPASTTTGKTASK